jgi:hypothetical protein
MSVSQDLPESCALTMTRFPSVPAHKLSQGGHLPYWLDVFPELLLKQQVY